MESCAVELRRMSIAQWHALAKDGLRRPCASRWKATACGR